MSFYAIYPAISGSGGGGGGITSINGDSTAAQVIAAGTGISVSSSGGTTTITNTSPGGSGTVTSVSVTTANGVSGTVANPTTTPAISLTLGAITPSSVAAVGTVTGSNLSGTNTGDQTITLTGDVTGSGSSSFAATIAANAVTNAKLAQMAAHTFKGNNTGSTADALDLTQTQLTAEINQFTTTLQGVVPGSGGGTANFLRADGTWATPPDTTGITQLTGDVTAGPGSGSQAAALVATTNATLTTLSGLTTAASLATVGTVTSGTWNATTIAINHGGTGQVTAPAAFDALSPLTTKGDLVAYSTTNDRLPVGSNGQVLTADSAQTLGVKWSSPGSSGAQNYIYNGGFDYSQRYAGVSIPNGQTLFGADRWYIENALNSPGTVDYNQRPGVVDGSVYQLEMVSSISPTTPAGFAGFLYQTLDLPVSQLFYNQSASFSAQIKAEGNVNQVSIAFMYNTSVAKVNTLVSSNTDFVVNSSTFTLCQIINEAIGTAMTQSGVIGIRIFASGASSGNVSDAGNGIYVEQAGMYIGNPPSTWARMCPNILAEKDACDYFYESSYEVGVYPGATFTTGGAFASASDINAGVDNVASVQMKRKRTNTPTVLIWAPDGTAGSALGYQTVTATTQALTVPKLCSNLFVVRGANTNIFYEFNWTADSEI